MAEGRITDQAPGLGLAIVHRPAEVKAAAVFIHGLNGNRSRTWTNKSSEFWPAWLGDAVPGLEVWTYGYNSAIWSNPSEDMLELHAVNLLESCVKKEIGKRQEQVIFVCHSLGGILAKAAIFKVLGPHGNTSWSYLGPQLSIVAFLGTPHRGSEWANRLFFLQIGYKIFRPGSQFVSLLRKGYSGLLWTTAERFNNLWGGKPVLTFRETKGVSPIGIIVKPEDARTNCAGEICVDVPLNHRRLAKIESKDEELFRVLVQHLKNNLEEEPLDSNTSSNSLEKQPSPNPSSTSVAPLSSRSTTPATLSTQTTSTSESFTWTKVHRKAFYRCLQRNIGAHIEWDVLDEEFSPELSTDAGIDERINKFVSGTFTFAYPGHEQTRVILTIPSKSKWMAADWTIISENSMYHPGRHDGYLELKSDFPFRPPMVYWNSPIVSPFVNSYGRTCTVDEYDLWSPVGASFYHLLHSLAAIVIFGPELEIADSGITPYKLPHPLGYASGLSFKTSNDPDAGWVAQVTNLFSRAYNRIDDDDDLDMLDGGVDDENLSQLISEEYRAMTVAAINSAITKLPTRITSTRQISKGELQALLEAKGVHSLEEDFARVTTLRQFLKKEREWVDIVNKVLNGVATKAWKVAESYLDRRKRLGE